MKRLLISLICLMLAVTLAQATQYARPDDDDTDGGQWDAIVNSGATEHWEVIDEDPVDHDDYVLEDDGSWFFVTLTNTITDPTIHTGHAIVCRMWKTCSTKACNYQLSLYEGDVPTGKTIATCGGYLSDTWYSTVTCNLSTTEAQDIGDYDDLQIAVYAQCENPCDAKCTQCYFEVPDVSAAGRRRVISVQ